MTTSRPNAGMSIADVLVETVPMLAEALPDDDALWADPHGERVRKAEMCLSINLTPMTVVFFSSRAARLARWNSTSSESELEELRSSRVGRPPMLQDWDLSAEYRDSLVACAARRRTRLAATLHEFHGKSLTLKEGS
ncbi:hypothetical protein VP1G_10854 [Cytospora mali]|uniref:Uncharacterized protein n=1 Tax=Cytospora mali TaxID=578113 RepID=A0A194UYV7_CYTMA|nr:hypothetical protein VP1G_10854 [Valsa mali var. pyri (nom. inval.)]